MSLTKRFMEFQEERDAIRAALQALIDDKRITNPVSVGIAKKVITDGNLDELSPKQKEVFSRFIAPEMKIACELCNVSIPLASYPEVIANAEFEGQVLCDGCLYYKEQMRKD
ncbi:MAG TPA: hypothetical protein VM532_11495 [Burkholderiales bacterium]|jgi:hypothetical protein|nr:hypothetical protein [Burkholderiales bacterium]